MKRSWLVLVAVIALGALAGIAIAGRPTSVDTVVINPPSSVASTTTSTVVAATTTVAAASTTSVTSSTIASTTSTTQPSLDPANLRVLVANGSNRPGIAGATADVLIGLGYLNTAAVDALEPEGTTTVFFDTGFEAAAVAVAVALNLTTDRVAPLPEQALTPDDSLGDVIVVIGADYLG